MKKQLLALSVVVNLVGFVSPGLVAADLVVARLDTPGTQRALVLPPAADHAPVISLGTAVDPETGQVVEGHAIIHYGNSAVRSNPSHAGAGGKCYTYIAKGTKWATAEPWLVNTANTRGLDGLYISTNLGDDIAKWEDAADGTMGNGISANILGTGVATSTVLAADTSSPDGQNEVYFANVSASGAIAVTVVWFNRFTKQIVEWDQVYDDIDYDWSATGEAGKMDFDNIATHELGHSVGMGDLYNSCTEETMYGYAATGEVKKRTLNAGDIAGINALY